MSNTFNLQIITPERKFFQDDIEMIIFKTPEGEMGVLNGHTPMIVSVGVGVIKIKKDGQWKEAVLTEGYMQIENDKAVMLVDTAEWPDEIDVNRARAAKERAEERLQRQLSRVEYIRSKVALARAMERLKVSGKG